MEKKRLDLLIVEKGLAKSREKAKKIILDKLVSINGKIIDKPSFILDIDCDIKIDMPETSYVGRGAYKLEKAIEKFNIKLDDKICIDVGASTGGFTDFMIKNGCKKVYAIDVGHGQLSEELRINEKVVNMEKTNFRYIDTGLFKEDIDFICIDVSFISLEHILPKVSEITNDNTEIVALVKPQFEAGKGNIGKNGIIKDKKQHFNILNKVYNYCSQNNLHINDITFSPIKGGDGNIEYLILLKRLFKISFENDMNDIFKSTVSEAFSNFK